MSCRMLTNASRAFCCAWNRWSMSVCAWRPATKTVVTAAMTKLSIAMTVSISMNVWPSSRASRARMRAPICRLPRVRLPEPPDEARSVGRPILRPAELRGLSAREPESDGRCSRVDHARTGLRLLGGDGVRGIAVDGTPDLPAEAAILERTGREHEHLAPDVGDDEHLPLRRVRRRLVGDGLVGSEADRRAHEQYASGDCRDAGEREDTPGHGSCIGTFADAHDPLTGEVDDVGHKGHRAPRGERHRARLRGSAELGAQDPLRAVVVGGVPAAEAVDAHDRARVRCVDEVPVPDVDPDVVKPVEEDEISGLERITWNRDRAGVVPLRDGVVRQ